jgi:hypothetical protein
VAWLKAGGKRFASGNAQPEFAPLMQRSRQEALADYDEARASGLIASNAEYTVFADQVRKKTAVM